MRTRGLSLLELLVALAIGSVLIIGAVTVYVRCSAVYAVNESIARLQETARFALNTLEPEIQLAGHWGLTNDSRSLRGTLANAPLALSSRGARCGAAFPLDLQHPLAGTNNSYALPCPASGGGARGGADVLVVRRADSDVAAADGERLQVYTTRDGQTDTVFVGGTAPAPAVDDPVFGPAAEVHDLIARAYYVASNSTAQAGLPALRRKTLQGGPSTGPDIADEEVTPGIEDLQVQFGIDPGADLDGDGAADDPDADGRPDLFTGLVQRYVQPDDASLDQALVVAARICIRARAESPEPGFVDSQTYRYADVTFRPVGDEAGYRRFVVCRTIHRRNAREAQP